MTSWDDALYLKFAAERTRPAHELLSRVPLLRCARAVDLGCGPGNSTRSLLERYPDARVIGVDSSGQMLARARAELPMVEFQQGDVARWQPAEPLDLVFANAVLHWVPDHHALLPRLLEMLRPGGVLAFQVPDNLDEPSHRAMRELSGPFSERIRQVDARDHVLAPSAYFDVLAPHAGQVDIWRVTYQHVVPSADAIVEWVKGAGLRPYLEALQGELRDAYLHAYTAAIDAAYPARAGGARLFPFPRLFVVAQRRH